MGGILGPEVNVLLNSYVTPGSDLVSWSHIYICVMKW